MRKLVALLALSTALATPAAYAQRESGGHDLVYFWEDEYRYGWSAYPDPRSFNPPPAHIRKAHVTITETCARLVGRQIRTDSPARVLSTQLEDDCIRHGGKL